MHSAAPTSARKLTASHRLFYVCLSLSPPTMYNDDLASSFMSLSEDSQSDTPGSNSNLVRCSCGECGSKFVAPITDWRHRKEIDSRKSRGGSGVIGGMGSKRKQSEVECGSQKVRRRAQNSPSFEDTHGMLAISCRYR